MPRAPLPATDPTRIWYREPQMDFLWFLRICVSLLILSALLICGCLIDSSKTVDTQIWKHNRKAIHTFMTPVQLEEYLPKQQVEYVRFLHDILTKPNVSAAPHITKGLEKHFALLQHSPAHRADLIVSMIPSGYL